MNERKLKTAGPIHDTVTGFDFRTDDPLLPRKAMRKKCLECVNLSPNDVQRCQIYDCALWPYRLGRGVTQDPEGKIVKKRERSEAQKLGDKDRAKYLRKPSRN